MLFGYQEAKSVNSMDEYAMEIFRQMQDMTTQNNQMSEEEKQRQLQRILQKLENGDKLTPQELSLIQRYCPEMYAKAMRIQAQRQQLENRLKQAKSKEEATNIYHDALNSISKEDPDKKALMAAYDKVYAEFKKTAKYQNLPKKEEERKENQIFQEEMIDEVEKEKRLLMEPEFDVNG